MVAYKVDAYYSPAHDGRSSGRSHLGIDSPICEGEANLSDKDRKAPRLRDAGKLF